MKFCSGRQVEILIIKEEIEVEQGVVEEEAIKNPEALSCWRFL